jgi:hypothetical protein
MVATEVVVSFLPFTVVASDAYIFPPFRAIVYRISFVRTSTVGSNCLYPCNYTSIMLSSSMPVTCGRRSTRPAPVISLLVRRKLAASGSRTHMGSSHFMRRGRTILQRLLCTRQLPGAAVSANAWRYNGTIPWPRGWSVRREWEIVNRT